MVRDARSDSRASVRACHAAAVGLTAAVVLAVAACSGSSPARSAVPAPSSAAPASGAGGADFAETCLTMPFRAQLAAAVRRGASAIVAVGAPTGKSVPANPSAGTAPAFYAVTLRSVRTLRGPAVAPGETAWSPGSAPGTANPANSEVLAPGGRLFAIVWPKSAKRDFVGPTLQLAPVVGADVVFTPFGCWDLTGLQPGQYQGSTLLRPVSGGSAVAGGTDQPAENGLYTVPLATVERIAAAA